MFSDGQPAIVDIGSGLYNAKTFSDRRYEIQQMQSSYHNLPEINGKMQQNGAQYKARSVSYKTENGVTEFSLDIAGAYADAGVNTWQRTFVFDRNANTLTINDEAVFSGDKNHTDTFFIVPKEPVILGDKITIQVENARPVIIEGEGVSFSYEILDLSYDKKLTDNWNGALWRIKASAKCGASLKQTFIVYQE